MHINTSTAHIHAMHHGPVTAAKASPPAAAPSSAGPAAKVTISQAALRASAAHKSDADGDGDAK